MKARSPLKALLCGAAVLLSIGCGSANDDFGGAGACQPGETFECTCASGESGVQACLEAGDALGPCDCSPGAIENGTGGFAPTTGGSGGVGGAVPTGGAGGAIPTGGAGGAIPTGGVGGAPIPGPTCCPTGDCICRDEPPPFLTSEPGPYATNSYSLAGVGCIHYPTNAEPPFSAVAVSDGFLGTGGCSVAAQTSGWGPFYASWGIVTMIIETLGSDQPPTRGQKLLGGVEGLKAENLNPASPIHNLLAGRYGTSGFSMGGGGTTYAATSDPTLRSSVGLMSWTPVGAGVVVPTLFTCGSSDTLATCGGHTIPAYGEMPPTTPKIRVTVPSGHAGQPSSGNGEQGAWGLAFQKVFLDGDERWRPVLLSGAADETNIQ